MDRGGVRLSDVVAANLASGRWTVRRGFFARQYTDHLADVTADQDRDPRAPEPHWSPETAAVMAIALASGAVEPPPDPPDAELLALTGDLRWIVEAVTTHLDVAHREHRIRARIAN